MLWIIRDPSKMLSKEPRGRSSRKVGIYCLYTYWKGLKRFQYFIHRNLDCLCLLQEVKKFKCLVKTCPEVTLRLLIGRSQVFHGSLLVFS